MKKILSLCATALLFSASASAQVTLNQSSFATAPSGWDSVSTAYGNSGIPLNIGGAGGNLSLDFSNLTYNFIDTSFVLHLPYAGYTYQEFGIHVVKWPQLYFDARSLFNIGVTGITKIGETLDGRGYSLNGVPGAATTDSLVFPPQTDLYSAPLTKIAFPATYNSTWSSSLQISTNFILTYSSFYNHTSCTYRSYLAEKDSVIGYGKVVVKTAAGIPSGFISVIQVKTTYHQVDSFFTGTSVPFNSNILAAFGLAQGQTTDAYDYKFYRAGEVTPLIDISFADNTFAYAGITRTYVHTQRLAPVGVPQIILQDEVSIYPNPIINRTFTINVPSSLTGTNSYSIINMNGQEVAADKLAGTGAIAINVPAAAMPGMYYVQLYNNGKQVAVKPIEVR